MPSASAGGASQPPLKSLAGTKQSETRKAQTDQLLPLHEKHRGSTSTNVACSPEARRDSPPLSIPSGRENGAAAVPMADRPTPATAVHHKPRADRFEDGASGQRRSVFPAGQRTRCGGGGTTRARLEWGVYARAQIGLAQTDSWFYVPLLLEALGVPHHTHAGFERPERWGTFVDRYRNVLSNAGVSAKSVVTKAGTYIHARVQERLMELDPVAAQYIGMWILDLRNAGASSVVPPLPEI